MENTKNDRKDSKVLAADFSEERIMNNTVLTAENKKHVGKNEFILLYRKLLAM